MNIRRADKKDSLRNAWHLVTNKPWPFEPEHKFHPERRWRFDWACSELRLALELDGVTYFGKSLGGHQTAKGIEGDLEKRNAAVELGWVVLHYTQRQVEKDPVGTIEQVLRVAEARRAAMYGRRCVEGRQSKCKEVRSDNQARR